MKEWIAKYQKAIVGTGAVAVLTLCYFQQKELAHLRVQSKTPSCDSLQTELFTSQTELGRWEVAMEIWKERDSVSAAEFETILYKETE